MDVGVLLRLTTEVIATLLQPAADLVTAVGRSILELAPTMPAGSGAVVLVTAVVAALALLAVALTLIAVPSGLLTGAPHPRRAIADTTRLTASHPDAPGHARPRAPGVAASAA